MEYTETFTENGQSIVRENRDTAAGGKEACQAIPQKFTACQGKRNSCGRV